MYIENMNSEPTVQDDIFQSYSSLPINTSIPIHPNQSVRSFDSKGLGQELTSEEYRVLKDVIKDLNKKIVMMHKQAQDLEDRILHKDSEIARLK